MTVGYVAQRTTAAKKNEEQTTSGDDQNAADQNQFRRHDEFLSQKFCFVSPAVLLSSLLGDDSAFTEGDQSTTMKGDEPASWVTQSRTSSQTRPCGPIAPKSPKLLLFTRSTRSTQCCRRRPDGRT